MIIASNNGQLTTDNGPDLRCHYARHNPTARQRKHSAVRFSRAATPALYLAHRSADGMAVPLADDDPAAADRDLPADLVALSELHPVFGDPGCRNRA